MGCCCASSGGIGKFFGHFARRYRRRYARRGLEPSQRHLVEGVSQVGYAGASLLEIGCGVGYLHQQLLREGAGRVLGVDISEEMLARRRANWRMPRALRIVPSTVRAILLRSPTALPAPTSRCSTRWCAAIPTPRRW